jgi:hypothetical protein
MLCHPWPTRIPAFDVVYNIEIVRSINFKLIENQYAR